MRRDHRLRLADGRSVHRPAVPPERPRLLDARRGRGDPARGRLHDPRRAALGEADRARGARFTLLCGYVVLVLAFTTMLLLWKEDTRTGRSGSRTLHRDRRRARRHAGLALAHRFGARPARRDGVGHRRSPARPRRRDHAVDLRCPADGRLCDGRRGRDRAARRTATRSRRTSRTSSRSRSRAPRQVAQQYPQYASQITAGAKQSFLDGDQWAYTAGLVAVLARRRARLLDVPEEATMRSGCSPSTTPRTRRASPRARGPARASPPPPEQREGPGCRRAPPLRTVARPLSSAARSCAACAGTCARPGASFRRPWCGP